MTTHTIRLRNITSAALEAGYDRTYGDPRVDLSIARSEDIDVGDNLVIITADGDTYVAEVEDADDRSMWVRMR